MEKNISYPKDGTSISQIALIQGCLFIVSPREKKNEIIWFFEQGLVTSGWAFRLSQENRIQERVSNGG